MPIRAISDDLDILVAFDQETIDLNSHELRVGGVIVADAKFNPTVPEGVNARLFPVPITAIAEEFGSSLFKNMAASGASWALLGLPLEVFNKAVEEEFGRKGAAVVEKNLAAVKKSRRVRIGTHRRSAVRIPIGPCGRQTEAIYHRERCDRSGRCSRGLPFYACLPDYPGFRNYGVLD